MKRGWRTIAAAAIGIGIAACGSAGPREASGSGATLAVRFADLQAIQDDLAARRGRPVFVNFWATWCGPCVEELPQLAALARDQAARGTDFIGISVDAWVTGEGEESETKVRTFMARAGVDYPNLIYRGDQDPLLNAFKLPGPIPYSILYDGRGNTIATWTGPVPMADLQRALERLHRPI